ncbi:MAG: hypothetical protein ACRDFC_03335 [Ignavibacteria bacterium]
MPHGTFDIPVEIIAKERANYYAEHDSKDIKDSEERKAEWNKVFNEEYKITLSDDYEIVDWAFNNMNWSDVFNKAIKVPATAVGIDELNEAWTKSEHEVITK